MKKWNIAGWILFVAVFISILYGLISSGGKITYWPIFFVLGGLALIGAERFAGSSKYGVFPIALLWTAYWAFVSYGLLMEAGLYGLALGLDSGSAYHRWIIEIIMYSYLVNALFFSGLALSNLVRFFEALFSLTKLEK